MEIDLFSSAKLWTQLRKVYTYPRVGVVNDSTFHNVQEMLLPENYVNLAKFIVQAEKVKRAVSDFQKIWIYLT